MKVIDNVYAIDASRGSYVYVIKDKDIILIDSGFRLMRRGILKELKAIGIQPENIKHLLLTHPDIDHIGNAAFIQKLSGCTVWISKEDFPYLSGERKRTGIKRLVETVARPVIPANIKVYDPAESLNGVEVIPTPGHTPGHVCLLYRDILFAGDLLHLSKGRLEPYPSFWDWDTPMHLASVEKLKSLSYKWICPAHSSPIKI
jgi:glyoxylase-like metal-dependent hydrolase (beta-lactamase superfamily II)